LAILELIAPANKDEENMEKAVRIMREIGTMNRQIGEKVLCNRE